MSAANTPSASESTTSILPAADMSADASLASTSAPFSAPAPTPVSAPAPAPPTAAEKGKGRAADPDHYADDHSDAEAEAATAIGTAAGTATTTDTEDPKALEATAAAANHGPACLITLLLSSGARHPYKIDDKYLAKRNVDAEMLPSGKRDPFSISVYTLKELIMREWRDEWDAKPASPSSIRLIYFGKLLDDKEALRQYNFSAENRNVVHMSVRPADIADDDEPKPGSKTHARPTTPQESTRCCVIL